MKQILLSVVLLVLTVSARAESEVLVRDIWMRESVPGQNSASLQLSLTVTKRARLLGLKSAWAESVEIQRLSPQHGKIQAQVISSVSLPRNHALVFREHKLALMMVGLKRPLHVGDRVPVSLTLEFPKNRLRIVEAEAEVKPLALSYKHYEQNNVYDHR
jgi:hypothetical protein